MSNSMEGTLLPMPALAAAGRETTCFHPQGSDTPDPTAPQGASRAKRCSVVVVMGAWAPVGSGPTLLWAVS
jgi:hypothetical protein